MTEYTRSIATALRLITKKGQSVTITYRSGGSYNPATGGLTVTETTATAYGVVSQFSASDIDGELIRKGDLLLVVAASGITKPGADDDVTLADATKYTIKNVIDVAPANESVIYKLQIRK